MKTQVFHCPRVLLPDGWHRDRALVIDEAGYISDITDPEAAGDAIRLSGPVIPGMVNVHSHIHQRLIAGLTGRRDRERDSFWSWREQMYRAVDQLDSDEFRLLATWGFMELLEGGYTSIGEFHYPHRLGAAGAEETAGQLLTAADQAGCALTLLPVWYRYSGFGCKPPEERQKPFVLTLDELSALVASISARSADSMHRVGVAPHSLRAVDAGDLQAMLERNPEGPVHLHISEQLAEVEECRRHHGVTPISLFARHVELDRRWCLIHATHAGADEIDLLSKRGAVVGICPTTEADLGDGLFPVRDYLEAGGRVAIGSDSNLTTLAAGELQLLEWGQRLLRHERNVLCTPGGHIGRSLWQQAAQTGADALDQPAGKLEAGRRGDFVVLDDTHPLLAGLDPETQLDCLVLTAGAGMIESVWVGGRRVVEGGRHPGRGRLAAEFVKLRQRLETGSA